MNYIYTITVFVDVDKKWGTTGGSRCWGYYFNLNDAKETIENNITDIREYTYNYAVIEKFSEGISPFAKEVWFYKFNDEKNKYEQIERPKELEHTCNFGIG